MIRQALAPLNALADATATAIVIVAHLNKGAGTDPLQRLGGSIGIPAAARSVLLLARDPDDPDGEQGSQRVLAHVKSNVSELSPSLRFNVEAAMAGNMCVETARIVQTGISKYTGSDLLVTDRRERGSKLAEAIAFLDGALADGPRPVSEVKAEAEEFGITEADADPREAETWYRLRQARLRRVGGHGDRLRYASKADPVSSEEASA